MASSSSPGYSNAQTHASKPTKTGTQLSANRFIIYAFIPNKLQFLANISIQPLDFEFETVPTVWSRTTSLRDLYEKQSNSRSFEINLFFIQKRRYLYNTS